MPVPMPKNSAFPLAIRPLAGPIWIMPAPSPDPSGLRLQVLGLCRFSVPSLGAFQVEHDSIEARRAMLYDPERLARRFLWFEHVLLPSIRGQVDKDFKLIVLLGEDFPDPWLSRMQALTGPVPQIVLEFAPPENHRQVCGLAMASHMEPEATAVAQFRLDDDDAVGVNFTRRLRRDIQAQARFFARAGMLAFDYGRGIVLRDTETGLRVEPCLTRYWTPGLAILTRPDSGKYILDFQHHLIWKQMATLTQVDQIMFVRGAHGSNDSAIPAQPHSFPLKPEAAPTMLRERFGIDLAAFEAALSGMRS